jgi:aspartyl-tRNA(Asn)/glutamyl-tRNA(Gln) amidotransferase subunit C
MITIEDVEHVARLARLELTEEEKVKFSKQLGEILKYAEQMNEIDTTDVEPMSHAFPVVNVFREDKVVSDFTKEELMANAPMKEDGFFRVPKIN